MGFTKFAQLVIGPAGSGKTTYCRAMVDHLLMQKRSAGLVNLDPAADPPDDDRQKPSIDIQDLVSLEEVMEELEYGPNGGLVYCMEYLIENFQWFEEQIGDYCDDYLLIDCPGQIELYTHIPVMKTLVNELKNQGYNVAAVYILDSQFVDDASKFLSGSLLCLSTMLQLELPHISIMSKMDLVRKNKGKKNLRDMEIFLHPDPELLIEKLREEMSPQFWMLNSNIARILDEFNMVRFLPLDITKESSLDMILFQVDHAIQYGEDQEVKDTLDDLNEEEDEGGATFDDVFQ